MAGVQNDGSQSYAPVIYLPSLAKTMEDYEREAAEEWQEVGEQKNRRRRAFVAQIPKAELARADFEPDTQARTQWRQHERPTKITTLPKDFVPTDKGSRRGRTATRDDSPFDTIPELSKIAKDTATEVFQQVTYDARRRQPNLVNCCTKPISVDAS